jgi:methyltransferase (TIGR00027 family)
MSTSFPIKNISDTAYGVAIYRALETERPDALFQDRFARALAGERGNEIMELNGCGKSSGWSLVVRTCIIDELILRSIEKEGIDTVINLGAGLDARPYRLSLPSSLRWIEVDFPAILDYKEQKLKGERPVCFVESVRLDLTDFASNHALFTRVNTVAKQVLVLSEGLIVYLTSEQVALLAVALHMQSNFCWWILDLASSLELKLAQKMYVKELTTASAKQQFAPKEGTDFFQRYGWRAVEFRSLLEEAHYLNREPPLNWILRRLAPFKKDGIVLLERV